MSRLYLLLIYVGIWLIATGCYIITPSFGFCVGGVLTFIVSAFFFSPPDF